jgi:hypothetical protein
LDLLQKKHLNQKSLVGIVIFKLKKVGLYEFCLDSGEFYIGENTIKAFPCSKLEIKVLPSQKKIIFKNKETKEKKIITKKENLTFPFYFFVRMWTKDQSMTLKKIEILDEE